jgi:hypothetical protein
MYAKAQQHFTRLFSLKADKLKSEFQSSMPFL